MSTALDTRCLDNISDLDDRELLQRVIEGEPAAWRHFFEKYERLILACIVRTAKRSGVTLQHDDTHDILGDVCVNLVSNDYRRLRMYRAERGCAVSSWVGVIATSTTHDTLRRNRRRHAEPTSNEELERVAEPVNGPEEAVLRSQRREIVRRTLEHFSSRDREFVRLYFDQDLPAEDIANAMGISLNTVYSKKAKVTNRLLRLVPTG